MSIGEQLRKLRKEMKISQKELGELLDVTQQQVSYYEKSENIEPRKLYKISETYHIDIQYFFGDLSINDYKKTHLQTNSCSDLSIPAGWDEMLEEISDLEYDKIKSIENIIRALISEFSK